MVVKNVKDFPKDPGNAKPSIVQSMVTGEPGVNTVLVINHVVVESKKDSGRVIIPPRNLVEKPVMEVQDLFVSVTCTHVQLMEDLVNGPVSEIVPRPVELEVVHEQDNATTLPLNMVARIVKGHYLLLSDVN